MSDLPSKVHAFENAEPIANHTSHEAYLDNLVVMLERMALMAYQDADIAATWLSRRKPKKGRRVPWRDRVRLSRRTRGHGRHAGDALVEAAKRVKKWRDIHTEFVEKEKAAAAGKEEKK